jgi:hypothetical protein
MMRLVEFFHIREGRDTRYTLEPESNGQGRLLAWEEVTYSGPGMGEEVSGISESDASYEAIQRGDIDRLIAALPPELQSAADTIRMAWEEALEGGEVVEVSDEGGEPRVEVVPKGGRGETVECFDGEEDGQQGFDDPDYGF